MSDQIEYLSATEYDIIGTAIWELVKEYPRKLDDPDVVAQYDALGVESSFAVLVDGGRYKKRNVMGGFTAEVSFRVAYKSSPQSSPERIDAQAFVGRVVSWLEAKRDFPRLTGDRVITKITTQTLPRAYEWENDNSTVYAAGMTLEYEAG